MIGLVVIQIAGSSRVLALPVRRLSAADLVEVGSLVEAQRLTTRYPPKSCSIGSLTVVSAVGLVHLVWLPYCVWYLKDGLLTVVCRWSAVRFQHGRRPRI